MKHTGIFVLGLLLALCTLGTLVHAQQTYAQNFTATAEPGQVYQPLFLVRALKYDPYPVNPGQWFDVWVKVQNVGQQDAQNATFALLNEYPFTASQTFAQTYGSVAGSVNAAAQQFPEEVSPQANQVLLKFHVKVADDASEGTYMLQLRASDPRSGFGHTYQLPIDVAKTKTNFEIAWQRTSERATTFTVQNTGDRNAAAVTVGINDSPAYVVSGPRLVQLGTLNSGDFAPVSFTIDPRSVNVSSVLLTLSYTDTGDVRNVLVKNVSVDLAVPQQAAPPQPVLVQDLSQMLLFGAGGLIVGILLAIIAGTVLGRGKGGR